MARYKIKGNLPGGEKTLGTGHPFNKPRKRAHRLRILGMREKHPAGPKGDGTEGIESRNYRKRNRGRIKSDAYAVASEVYTAITGRA